jgi:hypothetical protein
VCPTRAIVVRAVEITQPGRPIRRPQQQQEECPVSPVFGSGSAAFRTLHGNLAFGRAHAPPPGPASLLQDHFKNRKLVGHCDRFNRSAELHICVVHLVAGSNFSPRGRQKLKKIGNARIGFISFSTLSGIEPWYREATIASSKSIGDLKHLGVIILLQMWAGSLDQGCE